MDGNQICGRCKLYISFDKKEISQDEAKRGNMCLSCSKVWGRLAPPDSPCGDCIGRDDKMVAIQQNYERLRESASEDRLTHPQPVPRQPLPLPIGGKSSRTAEYEERLTNARSRVGNFKYLIVVEIACNGPKDVLDLHPFGRMGKEYGPTEVFAVVLKDIFTSLIIPCWAQSQQAKLDFRQDVTWSFSATKMTIDNAFFDPEKAQTLGTFVSTYSQPERYAQYFAGKEMKKGGGGVKQFVLNARLNYKMAMMRTENHYTSLSMPFGPLSSTSSLARPFAYSESGNSANARRSASGKKRRNDNYSSSEDEGAVREGRPMTRASAKIPQSPEKFVEKWVAPSTRQIVFYKRYAAVYGKTWAIHESRADPINGSVTELAFNTSGETKDVFILRVGVDEFAAKQFKYSILPADDTDTNLAFLEGELVQAAILRTQLQGFRDHIKKMPGVEDIVDIHPFAIPQTFIAIETTLVDGMKQHYICEPLRSRTEKPVKFSGINKAGKNAGAAGGTADAFAHYSLIASKGNLVLVDLQGQFKAHSHFVV
ncbi:hypothetical protein M407DRAFT_22244 [Tulasnella calospora MUT 4182]|uniref:Alpha-type protein kinase domain-containing protein n=1 Tax=Tulasnella calospora MUT 4182 TaxID=1051891 RepID=A0A0C3M4Q1_9AGAM|nr:hypothetical protein M407DRAFT_22244 [Tulasnella calospora MUT 4182]